MVLYYDTHLQGAHVWHVLTRDHTALHFYTFSPQWNEPSCLYSSAAELHRTAADTRFSSH